MEAASLNHVFYSPLFSQDMILCFYENIDWRIED